MLRDQVLIRNRLLTESGAGITNQHDQLPTASRLAIAPVVGKYRTTLDQQPIAS